MDLQSSDVRKQTPSGKHSHPEQRDKAPDGAAVAFGETLREEYQEIIERRKRRHSRHGRAFADDGAPVDLTGLALSGGGVRSAAFCLGALQAINAAGALNQVDYLSTVSGGGSSAGR
jgi:predicted acylesterase/phospholipase RssA